MQGSWNLKCFYVNLTRLKYRKVHRNNSLLYSTKSYLNPNIARQEDLFLLTAYYLVDVVDHLCYALFQLVDIVASSFQFVVFKAFCLEKWAIPKQVG